jgi:hypothetical protein
VAGEDRADPAAIGASALRSVAHDLAMICALHEDSVYTSEALGSAMFQAQLRAEAAAAIIDRMADANKPESSGALSSRSARRRRPSRNSDRSPPLDAQREAITDASLAPLAVVLKAR